MSIESDICRITSSECIQESFLHDGVPVMRRSPTIAATLQSLRSTISQPILQSLLDGLDRLLALAPELVKQDTMIIAPAVDHYWDTFRINDAFMTNIKDLYVVGDAVGRFRGMLQAAWSGLICGHAIQSTMGQSATLAEKPKVPFLFNKEIRLSV